MNALTDTHAWVRCPACDRDWIEPSLHKQGFEIVRCRHCRLRYVNPRPSQSRLAAMYRGGYFAPRASGHQHLRHDDMKLATARLRLEFLQEFCAKGRLLDVGCGGGVFVRAAREAGWSAVGLEPSLEAAAHAGMHRLPVVAGHLEQPPLAGGRFDAVTMFDVLEHVFSPGAFLAEARTLLAPRGVLLIETPNMAGWMPRLMGSRHPWVRPPEHLTYFTPGSLRILLERTGFRVLRLLAHAPKVLSLDYVLGLTESTNPLLTALAKQTAGRWHALGRHCFRVPLDVLLAAATVEPAGASAP
jgi:2-polyprenyl-3-methyl-5-hydroxy-6-metoxy-1,4-benzoquinol methylase